MFRKSVTLFISFILVEFCAAQSLTQFQDKLLLVVDVQAIYTNYMFNEQETNQLIAEINRLVLRTDSSNVVYIKNLVKVLSLSGKGFKTDTLDNLELDKRLNIIGNHIFYKSEPSAFESEDFLNYLHINNTTNIVVVGLIAECCVSSTIKHGLKLGYSMYVVPNAVIGKTQNRKERAIKRLQKKGVKIL